MKVENKVIVVTGGGSGMGRELVLSLLSKGSKVIAVDINESALQSTTLLANENKDCLHTFVTDITSKASVEELFAKSTAVYGGVDAIINNAGIIQPFLKVSCI